MTRTQGRFPLPSDRWIAAAAVLVAICLSRPMLWGQETGQPEVVQEEAVEQEPAPAEVVAAEVVDVEMGGEFVINQEMLDGIIFQPDATEASAMKRVRESFKKELDELCERYSLTSDQREKLALAGEGDLKRFLDRVRQCHQQLKQAEEKMELQQPNAQQDHFAAAFKLYADRQRGLFGSGSLFAKTRERTFSAEQLARFNADRAAEARRVTEVYVQLYIVLLQREIPLLATQREQLRKVILENIPPLSQEDESAVGFVAYKVSLINPQLLRPLLDDEQWEKLQKYFEHARENHLMLENQGFDQPMIMIQPAIKLVPAAEDDKVPAPAQQQQPVQQPQKEIDEEEAEQGEKP